MKKSSLHRVAVKTIVVIALAAPALSAACGGGVANDESADAGSDAQNSNVGDSGSPVNDSGSAIVDAGPDSICPAKWEVYGDTDPSDNLGHVDPRLVASGVCHGPFEQFSDGGFAASDFTVTMTQSAQGSGMFVAQAVQTTPFAMNRTMCLQSSGGNTGAAGYPDDGGLMCLTDVTEDQIPWDPNFVTFTNLEDSDGGVFINLNQSSEAGVSIGNAWCRFVKN